nr:hypothetical protein [Bacillus sp. M6-12]
MKLNATAKIWILSLVPDRPMLVKEDVITQYQGQCHHRSIAAEPYLPVPSYELADGKPENVSQHY